jgi:hypothetical protein
VTLNLLNLVGISMTGSGLAIAVGCVYECIGACLLELADTCRWQDVNNDVVTVMGGNV